MCDRSHLEKPPSKTRSRVTNGSALLAGLDARTAPVRRYKDLYQQFVGDIGGEPRAPAGIASITLPADTMIFATRLRAPSLPHRAQTDVHEAQSPMRGSDNTKSTEA